jgi:hypothetical protein
MNEVLSYVPRDAQQNSGEKNLTQQETKLEQKKKLAVVAIQEALESSKSTVHQLKDIQQALEEKLLR